MGLTDALAAALAPGVPVGVGDRPANAGTKPFIVIWEPAPTRAPITLSGTADGQTTTLVCHCIGFTPAAAKVAESKLAAAVYGLHRSVVGGRIVQWPEQLSSLPLTRDDDVSPPLYDLVVEWRLWTTPA